MADFAEAASRLAGAAALLLGWRPGEFWGATPAELAAVLAAMRGEAAAALGRADLERLMEAHPDG
jgi:uncharacterized phage protein (TIGR02216 family)